MTTRDDLRAEKALQGATFPNNRDRLIDYAETHGADAKSLQALRALPDREFSSKEEVIEAVPQEPEGENNPGGSQR